MSAVEEATMKEETDDVLMLYLSEGTEGEQRAALTEIYKRHAPFLYNNVIRPWCRMRQYDVTVADDLMQELVLHITSKAGTYSSGGNGKSDIERKNLRAWLGKIFRNLAMDFVKQGKPPFYSFKMVGDDEFDFEGLLSADQADDADISPQMMKLQEALDMLSERERDVVRLYEMEKDPQNRNARLKSGITKEIAASLDMSPDNLKTTYGRAMVKLIKHLNPDSQTWKG